MSKENKNQVEVKVLDMYGNELPATMRNGKVRKLLKEEKAKVIKKEPFTIQLLYDITKQNKSIENMVQKYENIISDYLFNLDVSIHDIFNETTLFDQHDDWDEDNALTKLRNIVDSHKDEVSSAIKDWNYSVNRKTNPYSNQVKYSDLYYVFNSLIEYTSKEKCYAFPQYYAGAPSYYIYPLSGYKYYNGTITAIDNTLYIMRNDEKNTFKNIFNSEYNKIIKYLDELKQSINKCYCSYNEFIRSYEPFNIIVTDRDIVPKFTNFKSIVIPCSTFEHFANIINYEENDDETSWEVYRNMLNSTMHIYIDSKSYFNYDYTNKILPRRITKDFELYFYNTDDINEKDTYVIGIGKSVIYDINNTISIKDLYINNDNIVINKRHLINNIDNYTDHNNECYYYGTPEIIDYNTIYKPDYTLHTIAITFDSDDDYDTMNNKAKKLSEELFSDVNYIHNTRIYNAEGAYRACMSHNLKTCKFIKYSSAISCGLLKQKNENNLIYFPQVYDRYEKKHDYISEYEKYSYDIIVDELYYLDKNSSKLTKIDYIDKINISDAMYTKKGYSINKCDIKDILDKLKMYKDVIENYDDYENNEKSILISIFNYRQHKANSGMNFITDNQRLLTDDEQTSIQELYDYIKKNGAKANIYINID